MNCNPQASRVQEGQEEGSSNGQGLTDLFLVSSNPGSEATGTSDLKASQLDSIPGAQGRSPGSMPGYGTLETSMDTEKCSIPWTIKFCPSDT